MRKTSRRRFLQETMAGLAGTLIAAPSAWAASLPKPGKADIVCLNRHTGELYWKAAFWPSSAGGVLYHSTGVANNTVYVQAGSLGVNLTGALHSYTGEIQWLVPNSGPHQGPLALANGLLYQGGSNPHKIEALDARTGKRLWEFPLPSIYRGGITVANGAVYTGNGGGNRWEGEPGPFSVHCLTLDGA